MSKLAHPLFVNAPLLDVLHEEQMLPEFRCVINISMDPKFAAICGITKDELLTDMKEDIGMLAKHMECSFDEM